MPGTAEHSCLKDAASGRQQQKKVSFDDAVEARCEAVDGRRKTIQLLIRPLHRDIILQIPSMRMQKITIGLLFFPSVFAFSIELLFFFPEFVPDLFPDLFPQICFWAPKMRKKFNAMNPC